MTSWKEQSGTGGHQEYSRATPLCSNRIAPKSSYWIPAYTTRVTFVTIPGSHRPPCEHQRNMNQTYSLSSLLFIGRRFNDAFWAIVSKFAHYITAVSRDGTDIPEVRQVNLGGGRRPNLFEECRGRGGYFDIENTPCRNSMHRTGVDIFKICP